MTLKSNESDVPQIVETYTFTTEEEARIFLESWQDARQRAIQDLIPTPVISHNSMWWIVKVVFSGNFRISMEIRDTYFLDVELSGA